MTKKNLNYDEIVELITEHANYAVEGGVFAKLKSVDFVCEKNGKYLFKLVYITHEGKIFDYRHMRYVKKTGVVEYC